MKGKDQGEFSKIKPKADLFTNLQKLKDHLSQEVDIFPSAPEPVEFEEGYYTEDAENSIEEPKNIVPDPNEEHRYEEYLFDTDIKIPTIRRDHWLKKNISKKSELRKLMVVKEVLGEPRSLKQYTGIYFQS